MKTRNLILMFLALSGLITGDNNAVNVPVADQWNQGQGMGQYGYDEFWNDTYLMWEMLYTKKGYADENIFVYYDDGIDFTFPLQDNRYNAMATYNFNITDQSATKAHIQNLFTNTLSSLVTPNDFLYVFVMSHGGNTNADNSGDAYFYAAGGQKVYDYELAAWLGQVNANRVAVQLQVPGAGGFVEDLAGEKINVIMDYKPVEIF